MLQKPPLVAPSEFANATIVELAEALDASVRRLPEQGQVSGVDAWLRPFSVGWSEVELAPPASASVKSGEPAGWHVFGGAGNPLVQDLEIKLRENLGVGGVLLYLEAEQEDGPALDLLLQAAKHVLEHCQSSG